MRCADLRARARDYFTNRLGPDVREVCDAHLAECADCAALFTRCAAASDAELASALGPQWSGPDDTTCAWILEFLAAYLESRLDARERALFDAHLALCPACRTYLAQYASTIRLARDGAAPLQALPPALVEAILAARRGSR